MGVVIAFLTADSTSRIFFRIEPSRGAEAPTIVRPKKSGRSSPPQGRT
jgi:hypothetical protein